MIFEQRTLLYVGLNYVVSPPPLISNKVLWDFRTALTEADINYGQASLNRNEINFVRQVPPLQIKVLTSNKPQGQLLMLSPQGVQSSPTNDSLVPFATEAEAICESYQKTWSPLKKIISCDCTVRYLFKSERENAFMALWQDHLHQSPTRLEALGMTVKGGGLRFVLDMPTTSPFRASAEVKIESYLSDPSQIYMAIQFQWPQEDEVVPVFSPADRLQQIEGFITQNINSFLS